MLALEEFLDTLELPLVPHCIAEWKSPYAIIPCWAQLRAFKSMLVMVSTIKSACVIQKLPIVEVVKLYSISQLKSFLGPYDGAFAS
jgi:hypothetical protein